jgi:hypothetical protein
MDKAREYRASAARALFEAQAAVTPEAKKILLALARAWLQLANWEISTGNLDSERPAIRSYSPRAMNLRGVGHGVISGALFRSVFSPPGGSHF